MIRIIVGLPPRAATNDITGVGAPSGPGKIAVFFSDMFDNGKLRSGENREQNMSVYGTPCGLCRNGEIRLYERTKWSNPCVPGIMAIGLSTETFPLQWRILHLWVWRWFASKTTMALIYPFHLSMLTYWINIQENFTFMSLVTIVCGVNHGEVKKQHISVGV